ncbi:MAG: type I-C CRISPR-associated protein Cas5c [Parvularculaceae bacterium]
MAYGVTLRVWGARACFTRPEMKVERVSYDVMTPSAARGVLEAIHWKPAIRWVIDRIHVLNPIRFETIRRNEVGAKAPAASARRAMKASSTEGLALLVDENRQQRAATVLRDVDYVIEAHFELTKKAQPDDTEAKHYNMFLRRAREGQCFHRPYLGTREFSADFELIESAVPASRLKGETDLGWMLYDLNFEASATDPPPLFFRPKMIDGVIDLRKFAPKSERLQR